MNVTGIVYEIRGERVTVVCRSECDKCGGCSKSEERKFEALNNRGLPLKPGDRVNVYIPPLQAVKAGFLILIFPLLLFFPFYYGLGKICPELAEPAKVLAGIGGITCGFLLNLIWKRIGKNQAFPEITRIVSENASEAVYSHS